MRSGTAQISPPIQATTAIDSSLANLGSFPTLPQNTPGLGSGFGTPLNGNLQKQTRGFRDHMSTAQLSRLADYRTAAYPSPADSNVESPPFFVSPALGHGFPYQSQMPPPYHGPTPSSFPASGRRYTEDGAEHRSKRMRYSGSIDPSQNFPRSQALSYGSLSADEFKFAPNLSPYVAENDFNSPSRFPGPVLTPAASTTSEDFNTPMPARPATVQGDNDIRRLSVKSLLSDDSEEPVSGGETVPAPPPLDPNIHYGVDRGFPDLDLPKNNDSVALTGLTPALSTPGLYRGNSVGEADDFRTPIEFGFGLHNSDTAHSEGGYYAAPVSVSIPRSLGILPSTLQNNPMNLLYFHHFLNHTARILVPHDCIENPFRSILPKMALRDDNLLNLLLAYSASHRARLLKHPEPANRIALWVQDIFPSLSRALDDPSAQVSNANLATAIMLASLEIISPNTFEVPIPWQSHLNVARRMLMARGGAKSIHRKDVVSYFLSRWFAYLDVLGSLSGGKSDQPLFGGDYWANDDNDEQDDFQIDCLIGFTSRCVGLLAKIAELARQCDSQRIDGDGAVIENWTPPPQILDVAQTLKADLQNARLRTYRGCPHKHGDDVEDAWDAVEMVATNEAFHWAGLIHLDRRVFGKPSWDTEIQSAVGKIVEALDKVRKGSTAEACLLFPMFTAGCHAKGEGRRSKILERLRSVEGSGMTQVCFKYLSSLFLEIAYTGL